MLQGPGYSLATHARVLHYTTGLDWTKFKNLHFQPTFKVWDWVTVILLQADEFFTMVTHLAAQICSPLGRALRSGWSFMNYFQTTSIYVVTAPPLQHLFLLITAMCLLLAQRCTEKQIIDLIHLKVTIFTSQGLNGGRHRQLGFTPA